MKSATANQKERRAFYANKYPINFQVNEGRDRVMREQLKALRSSAKNLSVLHSAGYSAPMPLNGSR